jgi:hypothetical protein
MAYQDHVLQLDILQFEIQSLLQALVCQVGITLGSPQSGLEVQEENAWSISRSQGTALVDVPSGYIRMLYANIFFAMGMSTPATGLDVSTPPLSLQPQTHMRSEMTRWKASRMRSTTGRRRPSLCSSCIGVSESCVHPPAEYRILSAASRSPPYPNTSAICDDQCLRVKRADARSP